MKIQQAKKEQAHDIALLIMEAMNHECCRNFAGPDHTLEDFERLMTDLVGRDDSQYSYRNTLVAVSDDGEIMGAVVCYDGGQLHELRRAFIDGARKAFGIDYSDMDDETEAGELYVDSLCTKSAYRGHGVASALLRTCVQKARKMNISRVGLLVDNDNPKAERLYTHVGFRYRNDAKWGGHQMKHLVRD
ncbi:MAG: GNAT family N-acetyltransferase [Prevotella sp.]|nr:GNAT family N-acetyltransferase [Prevotella sp.]